MKLRKIEILEKESNKKGDLFGRFMGDLFHALGYNQPILNINKSGREIDLQTSHRTEKKIAIAECKAHENPIGGADINKFIGVVDVEKRKIKKDKLKKYYTISPYFLSISGFKSSTIQQEDDINNQRVILMDDKKIIQELILSKIIVDPAKAASAISGLNNNLKILSYWDLFAHEIGWISVLYYSDNNGQTPTHFALIHANGEMLISELSQKIIDTDRLVNYTLDSLKLIPNLVDSRQSKKLEETKNKYFSYLNNELGDVQFEGLPTDKEAGINKVKLENIFIPLHLYSIVDEFSENATLREGIGEILAKKTKLAILAKPGGGKSTLLKRIAMAYAFPERRKEISDQLPERNWFPLFLRCRELGEKVSLSIMEIINDIPNRAEIPQCSLDFTTLVSSSLQNGNALLLIDGLDEITEDKSRIAFVNQLRTFIATYPSINIIVTSREAGFRIVAGSLATYCSSYSVSNLNEVEISNLCLKWHNAIIDSSENTNNEASRLSDLIIKDNRIKVLAENPLLLTTLLFVKRWAGYLPTKRNILYQEMIKLLLVTWNVEGHEILDIEEAEPQLAYVAYWMTKNGSQTIDSEQLQTCLIDARKQMPEILGYTKISPAEFIKRVELRSSLLIMSGHKKQDSGNIIATYEFMHLSFQEYLTAKAIVKRYVTKDDSERSTLEIIKINIKNESWKEVIPLVSVLLERNSKDIIEYLISLSKSVAIASNNRKFYNSAPSLLGNCIANEIQISPDILRNAIEWYAKSIAKHKAINTEMILNSKFGAYFKNIVREKFFEKYDDQFFAQLGSELATIFIHENIYIKNNHDIIINVIEANIINGTKEERCIAILGTMSIAFNSLFENASIRSSSLPESSVNKFKYGIKNIVNIMFPYLNSGDKHYVFSICWCVVWLNKLEIFPNDKNDMYINVMSDLWICKNEPKLHRMISWALCESIDTNTKIYSKNNKSLIEYLSNENILEIDIEFHKKAAIMLGTIVGVKFPQKVALEILNNKTPIDSDYMNSKIIMFEEKIKNL